MEGIAQIVLCSFFSSQLCASIFHEFPSSCHRIESPERGGKCQKKQPEKMAEQKHTERISEWEKEAIINRSENKRGKVRIRMFCVYLEREVADEKCFRRRQTFFG